jgi:hypothetical protein
MKRSPLRIATTALLAVLWTAPPGFLAQEPAPPAPAEPGSHAAAARGRITGKVLAKDGKTPVAGAIVRAAHLRTGEAIASAPTDAKGEFVLDAIPYGYVDLAVETSEGGFIASQVLNVPPDGRLSVTLSLTRNEELPEGWWAGRQPRAVPGTETPAVGVAAVADRGKGFLRSPKGIAILAGAGGLALLALSGGNDESPASPVNP